MNSTTALAVTGVLSLAGIAEYGINGAIPMILTGWGIFAAAYAAVTLFEKFGK